jgi:Cys-rich protein (TIGR01571 family)
MKVVRNRTDIRNRYGIRGSIASDFLVSTCCPDCALTQERRELELEESSS